MVISTSNEPVASLAEGGLGHGCFQRLVEHHIENVGVRWDRGYKEDSDIDPQRLDR